MSDFNNWDFDFDGWTLGEDAQYMECVAHAQRTGDLSPLYAHWARMIRHWPYAFDPSDLRSYAKIDDAAREDILERINHSIRFPKRPEGRTGGGET